MMMNRGIVVAGILAAVASALLSAGCGSSSDATLTKAEFTKQAAAICQESEKQRGKIVAEELEKANPKGDVQKQQEELIRKSIPTYEEAAHQIDALGAPKGEEKKVEALVEAMEEAAEKANADPHTAIISNIFFRKADQLLKGWKLSACMV